MLKRREECDAYLTHICRHPHSGYSPEKRLNISFLTTLWLSSAIDVESIELEILSNSLYFFFVFHGTSQTYLYTQFNLTLIV